MLVLHQLPGRFRARHAGLYDKRLSQYINVYCDSLYGVTCCTVSHRTATALVVYDVAKTTAALLLGNLEDAIAAGVKQAGALPALADEYVRAVALRDRARRGLLFYGLLYIAFKIKQALTGKFFISGSLRFLQAASIVTVIGGYPVLKDAYRKVTGLLPVNPDRLLWAASQFFTLARESAKGVLLLWLKELGNFVKYSADADCFRILGQNLNKTAGLARAVSGGEDRFLPVCRLDIGDTVEVRKGELVPADGIVSEGTAQTDSLYYAGHPMIRRAAAGSRVYEGMAVLSGTLLVRVSALPDAGTLPKIGERDMRAYRSAADYARGITWPALIAAAVRALMGGGFSGALTLLLATSPTAVTSAFSTGIQNYAALLDRHRLYVRNPYVLERLSDIRHIVFDKTGTLTTTRMELRRLEVFGTSGASGELLKIAAACEADHYHPVAVSLREAAERESNGTLDTPQAERAELVPSRGIDAVYGGRRVLLGGRELLEDSGVDITEALPLYEATKSVSTPVFMALDGRLAALFILEETFREKTRAMIDRLLSRGADLTLVTGDSRARAEAAAAALGIGRAYGGLNAEEKLGIVRELQKDGPVLMAGDGINDLAAMGAADISVSFIDAACDKARLQSDVILYEADMDTLADLLSLSEKALGNVWQSVSLPKVLNAAFGALALLGRIDIFRTKSLNTVGSLLSIGLNQRILFQTPDRYSPPPGR